VRHRTIPSSREVNEEYYLAHSPGRADYWRRMAAPRFRVASFLRLLAKHYPSSLVDLGCGNGKLLKEIQCAYSQIKLCGIDLSPTQTEANRIMDPSIDWRSMDLDREVEFPGALVENFDAVMASEIIEHVDDPGTFLRNALMLAKPGSGKLFLSTQSGRVWETERRVGHRRHFSRDEMKKMLVDAGWRKIRIWNAGFPFHDMSKWYANIDPDLSMRRFGDRPYGHIQNCICMALRFAFMFNSGKKGAQLFAVAERGPEGV